MIENVLKTTNFNFEELEAKRKKQYDIENKVDIAAVIFIIIIFIIVIVKSIPLETVIKFQYDFIFSVFIIALNIGLVYYVIRRIINAYFNYQKAKFKNKIITKIIKTIDKNNIYKATEYIDRDIFKDSLFVSNYYNVYKGEDYFSCNINWQKIYFSELEVGFKQKSINRTHFKGIFFFTKIEKQFEGRLTIVPKTIKLKKGILSKISDRFFKETEKEEYRQIRLKNDFFDRKFNVFTDNELLSNKLFNSEIMEYLLEIERKFAANIYFSYSNNKIYFAINKYIDIFPIDLETQINEEKITSYYNEFQIYINIILKLSSIISEN